MGVKGLESFVRENRTSLTKTVTLPPIDTSSSANDGTDKIPIIVDAWGIIFKLYLDSLPWTSGGEYLRYYKLVKQLVQGWRNVGLEPTFVFDGAGPPEKHETTLSRASEKLLACQLFYTTSVISRSSPSFARGGKVVLPFFASQVFTFALHRLGVKTHFVPAGEADGICVSMAEKVGGYVFGRDSDFIILIGRTERVRGYVPIDMINWIEGPPPARTAQETRGTYVPPGLRSRQAVDEDSAFQPVQNGRRHPNQPNRQYKSSMIPSSALKNPSLVMTFIPPHALRHRLRLPSTHLPLFASLCGTDYTPPNLIQRFFEPGLTMFQRIEKAARILREQLFAPANQSSGKNRQRDNPGDQVVELVKKVIKKLCVYPFDTEQELDEAVNIIIEAALQYHLPPTGECCTTYPFCGELDPALGCRTPVSLAGEAFSPEAESSTGKTGQGGTEAYAAAQRDGLVGTIVHGWLYPDRMYQWQVLEDISGPCLKASSGARNIRRKAWDIADQGLGGLRFPTREVIDEDDGEDTTIQSGQGGDRQAEDDSELRELLGVPIETGEVESTPSEVTTLVDNQTSHTKPSASTRSEAIREMTEYLRQGSTAKIIPSTLVLSSVQSSDSGGEGQTPICLRPREERLNIYLEALHSNIPSIRALPPSLQPLVSLLRLCVVDTLERAGKYGQNRWKRDEVTAVLKACIGTYTMWKREIFSESEAKADQGNHKQRSSNEEEGGGRMYPLLETRNCQLIAQLGSFLSDTHILAQALLLLPEISSKVETVVGQVIDIDTDTDTETKIELEREERKIEEIGLTHIIPFVFFSGINIHTLLSKDVPSPQSGWKWREEEEQRMFDLCWNALVDGLDESVIVGLHRVSALPTDLGAGAGANREGDRDELNPLDSEESLVASADKVANEECQGDGGRKKNKHKHKKRRKSSNSNPNSNSNTNTTSLSQSSGRFGVLEGLMD
ncbi:uncharacterized protein I303_102175 [Kwoniella dejecticola CBS 10117]|uniref:Asteroid domain-containing protein n=1 Tax=Kwoniella dejecticola CBS 10117 TaxID=1296121 RepID=A0A1A6ABQ1_9TREE|nr:uncharacterized protein I303_01685 [Kwoniella dejecticola CBS 10117]OBR87480.1 hypothetical protein I303_01685 [Kwoniella dejecticola CBS 10117]